MVIGIIYDENKAECFEFAKVLEATSRSVKESDHAITGVSVSGVSDCAKTVSEADLLISVGGDGTFLKTASMALSRDLPVCGFNLGTLGLLTEFEHDNPEEIIRRLAKGDYVIEDRHVLRVQVSDADGNIVFDEYALNDCVLERGTLAKLAYVTVNIGGAFVDNYPCNGIVVATQTGSTAYSMSSGGPIVEPGNDVIVVTPVCAHFTDGRPIIARADSTVTLSMRIEHESMYVSVDGHKNIKFGKGFVCRCMPSGMSVRVIRMDPPNFYEVLRQKAEERRRKLAR
ncbi:MAG: NAD(+)/NADH kinase [Clostridia bacterium]|nr:NAD(+)/NADH kinase [Clostridia bacterium]